MQDATTPPIIHAEYGTIVCREPHLGEGGPKSSTVTSSWNGDWTDAFSIIQGVQLEIYGTFIVLCGPFMACLGVDCPSVL